MSSYNIQPPCSRPYPYLPLTLPLLPIGRGRDSHPQVMELKCGVGAVRLKMLSLIYARLSTYLFGSDDDDHGKRGGVGGGREVEGALEGAEGGRQRATMYQIRLTMGINVIIWEHISGNLKVLGHRA
jgi:hypothetical protein